jgi:FMN reductase
VSQKGQPRRIAVVVGNPKARSRTYGVATAVADALVQAVGAPADRLVVDLTDHAGRLFDPSATEVNELTVGVATSDVVVVASPTYKATYTGLLKAFFDRYGANGLAGTIAVPVMTGAAPLHALAVEVHLRPLLVELAAAVPTRGLYVTEAELGELDAVVAAWSSVALPLVRQSLGP